MEKTASKESAALGSSSLPIPKTTLHHHGGGSSTHTSKKVDLSSVNRGVWLVKVPKYIASRWENLPDGIDAGKLAITKIPGSNTKPKVMLTLSEATLCVNDEKSAATIPKEHELILGPSMSSPGQQSIGVFSVDHPQGQGQPPVIKMEGRIQQRLECRPAKVSDPNYLDLKLAKWKNSLQPQRKTIQLDRAVVNYKPVANHKNNIEYDERKKAEGKKARDEREVVLEVLFRAFGKHQFYHLKDLVRITNQPVNYIKELLHDVAIYSVKNPHKNMWELKPEYRHYSKDADDGGGTGKDKKSSGSSSSSSEDGELMEED